MLIFRSGNLIIVLLSGHISVKPSSSNFIPKFVVVAKKVVVVFFFFINLLA